MLPGKNVVTYPRGLLEFKGGNVIPMSRGKLEYR